MIFAFAKIVHSTQCAVCSRFGVAFGDDFKRGVAEQRPPKLFTLHSSLFTLFSSGEYR